MKWKLVTTITLITGLVLLAGFLARQPRTFYISTTGSEGGNCTKKIPCKNLTHALSQVQPGEIIYFMAGIYSEPIVIDISGTDTKYITITGSNAILTGITASGNYIKISGMEVFASYSHGIKTLGNYIIIENSKVHHSVTENGNGPQCNQDGSSSGWGSGIKVERGSQHITIRNNEVYENCGEGIAATMGKFVTISNNIARDNYSVNIYVDNSSFTTVDGNQVICTGNGYLRDERRATGIALGEEFYEGWGAQRDNNSVINNVVDGCYEGISSWEPDVAEGIERNLIIKSNTVLNGTYQGISLYWHNQNVRVEDNHMYTDLFIEHPENVYLSNNTVLEDN